MPERPRGFNEDTNTTPLHLSGAVKTGPKRPCLVVIAGARLGEIFPIEGEILIGRDGQAGLRLAEDESVSRKHARVTVLGDDAAARITDLGSANGTWVDGERVNERVLREGQKVRVGQTHVLKFARYDALEEQSQRLLLDAALRDGLTRAFNRRYFLQRLSAELRFAERHKQKLALLFLDVDHFKSVNDELGHPVGDDVLERLVKVLQGGLRLEDVLARYGGEEFAVLARNIPRDHAMALAERLRTMVAGARFGADATPRPVTISIGVAMYESGPHAGALEKLVEAADAALYRAKREGRNRVVG
jgi:diguanylate cyclase (GGDEF)-like protein